MYGNQHGIASHCKEAREKLRTNNCFDPRCYRCWGINAKVCMVAGCQINPPQISTPDIMLHCSFCDVPGGELLFVGPTDKAIDTFLRHTILEHWDVIATLHETYTGLIPHLKGILPWHMNIPNEPRFNESATSHAATTGDPAPNATNTAASPPAEHGETTTPTVTSD